MEDLTRLHQFTPAEFGVLQEALTRLITQEQYQTGNHQPPLLSASNRTYTLRQRNGAANQLQVREPGKPDRVLNHRSIFSWSGFASQGLAGRDTALAILADVFEESLTRWAFLQGTAPYCAYYLAFTLSVLPALDTCKGISTTRIAAFLHREHAYSLSTTK